jgi:hypothetical protein
MAGILRRSNVAETEAERALATRTAVETIRDGGRAVRTHVLFAPLFVLAQDYDDVMRALRNSLEPHLYQRMAYDDQLTLTLFASVAHVLRDMVERGERIAHMKKTPDPMGNDSGMLESLQTRQFTEQVLVTQGEEAIAADIAILQSRLAETRAEFRAESTRQLLDVAPYPQPGSAAAELSVLLSGNRARHRD